MKLHAPHKQLAPLVGRTAALVCWRVALARTTVMWSSPATLNPLSRIPARI